MYILYETRKKVNETIRYHIHTFNRALLDGKMDCTGAYCYYNTEITECHFGIYFIDQIPWSQIKVYLTGDSSTKRCKFIFSGFGIQDSIYINKSEWSWLPIKPKMRINYFSFNNSTIMFSADKDSELFIPSYFEYRKTKKRIPLGLLSEDEQLPEKIIYL